MSLRKEAGRGVFWVAITQFGQQILTGIAFIILARLLNPEHFGLVGMLLIFIGISQSFIDSGMGQALIREKEITNEDRATVFWLNLILSLLFYSLLYFLAPFIADFYNEPLLIDLTRFMSLTIVLKGVTIVQQAEMTQQLKFKTQAYALLPALLFSSVTAIVMAYMDFGVWALATQQVVFAAVSSFLFWFLQPSKILLIFNKKSFIRLFSFGYKLLLSGLLNITYQHIYKLVIGKFFIAATLGFYTQAQKIQELASQSLIGIIQKVTYPLLSKASNDKARLKRGYKQVVQASSFLIFPPMLFLIIYAEPIMRFVLGNQWLGAAPFLQLLCAGGILYHLHSINLNILKVLGRSDLFLKLEIIKKIIITLAIIIGLQYGLYGLLIGQVISSYLALLVNSFYTERLIGYSLLDQGKDVGKVLVLSVPTVIVSYLLILIIPIESFLSLLLSLFFSLMVYLLTSYFIKTEATNLALNMVTPYLPKKVQKIFQI